MRKSTVMKKGSFIGLKSPKASKESLIATNEKAARQKTGGKQEKQLLPGNIALDLRDPDEDDWMAKM